MSTSPDIVQVSAYYPPRLGGIEAVVREISERLAVRDDVLVLTTQPIGGPAPDAEHDGRLTIRRCRAAVVAHTPLAPALVWQLLRVPATALVHVHVSAAFVPEAVLLTRRLRGGDYIAHFHMDIDASGRLGTILLPAYQRLVTGRVLRGARRVIVLTEEQVHLVSRRYRVDRTRVDVVPNGVSADFARPAVPRRRDRGRPLRVLFVGRLDAQKNVPRLVAALTATTEPMTVTIVGAGEHEHLLRDAQRAGRLPHVELVGALHGAELRARYETADAFVLTSDREGMPLVLLEALTCGLPVVSTDVDGIAEVVADAGLVVPTSARDVAAALDRLAADPELYDDLARRAWERGAAFAWEPQVDRIRGIYARADSAEASGASGPDFEPTWCFSLDLDSGAVDAPAPAPERPHRVRALVRSAGEPLGHVDAPGPLSEAGARGLLAEARRRYAGTDPALISGTDDRLGRARDVVPVTVAVCTRSRPELLRRCLDSLDRLRTPPMEILVVDSSPEPQTRALVEERSASDPRLRYVREPHAGISFSRNRALRQASGDIVAFADDDTSVDEWWLDAILRGFDRRGDVAIVTGSVPTAAIETPAAAYFDTRASSWGGRMTPRIHDLRTPSGPLHPFAAAEFGTGANLAIRRDVGLSLGFDPALGVGSPSMGGEDLDVFVRALRAGHAIAFEPASVVWHFHRATDAELRRQMLGYGVGVTAFATKLLADRRTRGAVLRRVPAALAHVAGALTSTRGRAEHAPPTGAALAELRGLVLGPHRYLRARRRADRLSRDDG